LNSENSVKKRSFQKRTFPKKGHIETKGHFEKKVILKRSNEILSHNYSKKVFGKGHYGHCDMSFGHCDMSLSFERCHVTSVVSCSEKALFFGAKGFLCSAFEVPYLRKDFFGKRAGIPSVLRLLPVAAPPTAERRRGRGRRVRQRPPSSMGANLPRLAAVVQIPPLLASATKQRHASSIDVDEVIDLIVSNRWRQQAPPVTRGGGLFERFEL
jgi:hypothetical protein